MKSLYGRLFTYRQREGRTPLEDFLTEALADLLNRVPEEIARRVVELLLAEASGAAEALSPFWLPGIIPEWRTQVRTGTGKIVDLVMSIGGAPMIAIESKVAAGFQRHQGPDPASPPAHQLATYCNWIREGGLANWGGATILLTHSTSPPEGFLTDERAFRSTYRSVARWAELGQLLKKVSEGCPLGDWPMLATELIGFMKEQGLTEEYLTLEAVNGAPQLPKVFAEVRSTFKAVWERSFTIRASLGMKQPSNLEIQPIGNLIWSWSSAANASNWAVCLCISFGRTDWWHSITRDWNDEPRLIVVLNSNDGKLPADDIEADALSRGWSGWQSDGRECVWSKQLTSFISENFSGSFIAEAAQRVEQGAMLLASKKKPS